MYSYGGLLKVRTEGMNRNIVGEYFERGKETTEVL
jgi:hypothetical protein